MTQTTFTDNVLVDGSQDIKQLRVQGHTTQNQQLQTWEDSAGNVVAQVTGDGRLIVGDDVTPDSLIESHRLDTSTSKPKRGIHSLGQVSGTLNALVQWIVGELELTGASAISALHTALRIRASNKSTTAASAGAEVRGADIEVINDALANTAALPKATGLQVGVTNASGKTITDAIGLKVKMDNSGTITNPFSIYTEGPGPLHLEDYMEVKRPSSVPGTPATDFMRIYPKSDGKLYSKNWSGSETELGGGSLDNPGINNVRLSISSSDPNPVPGSTGTSIYVHPFNGEQISLYDTVSSKFIPRAVSSPIAFDMTAAGALGGNQAPFMPQDIFLAWDAVNSVFLKKVIPWASAPIQKSVTNITNASPPVLTVGASHGFAVDDLVVLQGVTGGAASLTNKLYRVVAITSTTISLGNLAAQNIAAPGGTSTNGTLYKVIPETTRATALTIYRGIRTYFDSGTGNYYKYLGTAAYGEIKETIYDTLDHPFIWNEWNRLRRRVSTISLDDTGLNYLVNTTTHTPSGSRPINGSYINRIWILTGRDTVDDQNFDYKVFVFPPSAVSANNSYTVYLAKNSVNNFAPNSDSFGPQPDSYLQLTGSAANSADSLSRTMRVEAPSAQPIGLNFWQAMEYVFNSGVNSWNVVLNLGGGSNNQYQFKGGFEGVVAR